MDHRSLRYIALKLLVAEVAETNELKIHRHLAQVAGPKFSEHFTELLDEFEYCSPNGTHLCFVMELMGPSVSSMVEDLPWLKRHYEKGLEVRYPIWMVKRILRQILQALEILHQNGITHGDLQPGNMLFVLKNPEHIESDKMYQDENYKWGSISKPVKRLDGKPDKWGSTISCRPPATCRVCRHWP
jgi:serine/threonine protein kinase